eukprot:4503619-Lingulodinium_polyedra.AAC.1
MAARLHAATTVYPRDCMAMLTRGHMAMPNLFAIAPPNRHAHTHATYDFIVTPAWLYADVGLRRH